MEWRGVNGWPYEVSDTGLVRSIDRVGNGRWGERSYPGKVLKPNKVGPYLQVALQKNRSRKDMKVHRLVLEAFVGLCPPGKETRHLNGDSEDNRLVNLAWGSRVENAQDRVAHGHHPQLNKTHCPQGHPYDEENTYRYRGGRHCRICRRRQFLEFKEREGKK